MFKKILALIFLFFFLIMWGCDKKEGDPDNEDRDKPRNERNDNDDNDNDSKTGIKGLDDFVDNMKDFQENFEEGKDVETVDFRDLKALIPESVAGLDRTS
ncbi:MAG: hypothetical protein KJO12_06075, partial [Ignavibacteria bacterium]|nr:hypothetical protein [Ignavibacteria bacterium]